MAPFTSCLPPPRRFIAYGALVGGPDSLNGTSFPDSREFYQYTEPALDYSGATITSLAALCSYYDGLKPYSSCKLDLGWSHKGGFICFSALLAVECELLSQSWPVQTLLARLWPLLRLP